jgi:hypothetical protein
MNKQICAVRTYCPIAPDFLGGYKISAREKQIPNNVMCLSNPCLSSGVNGTIIFGVLKNFRRHVQMELYSNFLVIQTRVGG